VAKKFSLKDNPIFQRLAPPVPPEAAAPLQEDLPSDESLDGGQILTLNERPSEFDPQNLTPIKYTETPPAFQRESTAPAQPPTAGAGVDLDLQDQLDKSLFFSFYNEMADELLPTLDPARQVLYHRLFRLSYGFNRNYCTVSQSLLIERTGLSRNTVRTTLQSLIEEGWIKVVDSGNRVSTSYRVILPRERERYNGNRGPIAAPQNLTLKESPSNFEPQEVTRTNRGSASDPPEGQFSALQNLTGNRSESHNHNIHNDLHSRPSKFEGQPLPPLLRSLTHRSLTLSEREPDPQILTLKSLLLSARELVEKFYSLLGQRVPKAKRERSIQECLSLLQEGFAVDEVDYAISWLITHHPTTGSFARLPHFIDQALKERTTPQSVSTQHHPLTVDEEKDREQRQQLEEEQQQIEEVKTSLAPKLFAELREEARRLIKQENPNIRFGENILIQLKIDELVKNRYLSNTS
jgi:hypothetical protein